MTTMNETKSIVHTSTRLVNLAGKPTIKLSQNLVDYVNQLHKEIGSVEWNGTLFYKIDSGSIEDLDNLVLEANCLYPMAIGSAGGVTFDYSAEILDAYDVFPEAVDCFEGTIHTHHNMGAFFSGTDLEDIKTNAPVHVMYLSLIVDFAWKPQAKLCFPVVETITNYQIKDGDGGLKDYLSTDKTETVILVADCIVEIPEIVINDSPITARIAELQRKKSFSRPPYQSGSYKGYSRKNYLGGGGFCQNDYSSYGAEDDNLFDQPWTANTGSGLKEAEEFLAKCIGLDTSNTDSLNVVLASSFAESVGSWEDAFEVQFESEFDTVYRFKDVNEKYKALRNMECVVDTWGLTVSAKIQGAVKTAIQDARTSMYVNKETNTYN